MSHVKETALRWLADHASQPKESQQEGVLPRLTFTLRRDETGGRQFGSGPGVTHTEQGEARIIEKLRAAFPEHAEAMFPRDRLDMSAGQHHKDTITYEARLPQGVFDAIQNAPQLGRNAPDTAGS